MKAKLLLVIAVLVLCAACAGVVAAPVATPTPKPTFTSAPSPTTDPLVEELKENVRVCLLTPYQYLATIPVGGRVSSISFHWVVANSEPTHTYTIRVAKETWGGLSGYETFHFVSTYKLSRKVWVGIVIDGRSITLHPAVDDCSPLPPNPQSSG